ncbi:MAG: ATP-binding protein [Kiritimatiellae bacterium]|nr:ATP-binding protein [Kiritimatiellia bacterium]
MTTKTISEAPESNAGDDFHVLWTIRKSFNLLNFEDDGLKSIVVEGITPKDAKKIDPSGAKLLGVDITEYFGGHNFNTAKKIVISQLKYSTRRTTQNITFSELYKGKKQGSTDGSMIHRLAEIYQTFATEYKTDEILKKVSIKLISNRNISPSQKKIIINIQNLLAARKGRKTSIYKEYPQYKIRLEKLKSATKLNLNDFLIFTRLINFDDCGTNSSLYHTIKITEALQQSGIYRQNESDHLYRMICKKMLPDAIQQQENKIELHNILAELGTNLDRLFPINNKFAQIENIIERKQLKSIIQTIVKNNTGLPICITGDAGSGKSTISRLIGQTVSENSEVILFDCYGAGEYLNPSDCRHLHREAILQISNELAKKLQTPFLLDNNKENYILIRELKDRIKQAISILKQQNPEALLILIIDAADNSIIAAREKNHISFIEDLVKEANIENFRLVVTTRKCRVESIPLPQDSIMIELSSFEYKETKQNLRFYYKNLSDTDIEKFHKLTNGNPRVQSYILANANTLSFKNIIQSLGPNGKTLKDIFKDRIKQAKEQYGTEGTTKIKMFFNNIISLPRPIPIDFIEKTTTLSIDEIHDLSIDISPMIYVNCSEKSETLSFRDEDFETHIRDTYPSSNTTYKNIANSFLEVADSNIYAAKNLGGALYNSGKNKELIEVVINEKYIEAFQEPIIIREVSLERARLALKACNSTNDILSTLKLIFITAELSKNSYYIENLLLQNTDLFIAIDGLSSLKKLEELHTKSYQKMHIHCLLAATYSRTNLVSKATYHIGMAKGYQDIILSKNETTNIFDSQQITDQDIAYIAEAILRIQGIDEAYRWLKQWRPLEVIFNASNILFDNILQSDIHDKTLDWVSCTKLPLLTQLLLIDKTRYLDVDLFNFNNVSIQIIKLLEKDKITENYLLNAIITFCEISVISNKFNNKSILTILEYIDLELPEKNIHHTNDDIIRKTYIDIGLRTKTLKAILLNTVLSFSDLYPPNLTTKNLNQSQKKRKEEFDSFYCAFLLIYEYRANTLFNKSDKHEDATFIEICHKINRLAIDKTRSYTFKNVLKHLITILSDSIYFLDNKDKLLEEMIDSFNETKDTVTEIILRQGVAKRMASNKYLHSHVSNLLCNTNIIEDLTIPATEKSDLYMEHANLFKDMNMMSKCKYYFNAAIKALSHVDTDAYDKIICLKELSQQGIPKDDPILAFDLAHIIEFYQQHLYGDFPFAESIQCIAHLDSASAFAIMCRWSHKNLIDITETILDILKITLDKGFINHHMGSSLLSLNTLYNETYIEYIQMLILRYDNEQDSQQKNIFITNTLNDIQRSCSSYNKKMVTDGIYQKVKNGRFLNTDLVNNFKTYNDFISEINQKEKNTYYKKTQEELKQESREKDLLKQKAKSIDTTSSDNINTALIEIQDDNTKLLDLQAIIFLSETMIICAPENHTKHLNALINTSQELLSYYCLKDALKDCFKEWRHDASVICWKNENFKTSFNIWTSSFYTDDDINYKRIKEFAEVFEVDDATLLPIIITFISDKLNNLNTTSLYSTITFMKNEIDRETNKKIISWVISKLSRVTPQNINRLASPMNTLETLTNTIRFSLGHPVKHVRWRSMYALKRMAHANESDIFDALLEKQDKTYCEQFQHSEYKYFWISSKLYLWICIAKLSSETPEQLYHLKEKIYNELLNEKLGHALILYFIKQTCINLHKHNNNMFSTDELKRVEEKLTSKLPTVQKERNYSRITHVPTHFNFSYLDTLPYWYENLGRLFNTGSDEVAKIADIIIKEQWGYIGNVQSDNHVMTDRSLTDNYKGTLPRVENLKTYYEYHAMHCAALKLLQTKSLVEVKDSWFERSWDDWIKSYALFWENTWIGELSHTVPLEKRFWVSDFDKHGKKWKDSFHNKDYDEVLDLTTKGNQKVLNLSGDYNIYFNDKYEHISISSALVSNKTANSLLKSLQTAESYRDYKLPSTREEQFEDENDTDFKLSGWLQHKTPPRSECLDKNDPYGNDYARNYISFGKQVNNIFKDIEYTKNNTRANLKSEKISDYFSWSSNMQNNKYFTEIASEGFVFKVDFNFLLDFLKKINMSLIVECIIQRTINGENYKYKCTKSNSQHLYLFAPNGDITTTTKTKNKLAKKIIELLRLESDNTLAIWQAHYIAELSFKVKSQKINTKKKKETAEYHKIIIELWYKNERYIEKTSPFEKMQDLVNLLSLIIQQKAITS